MEKFSFKGAQKILLRCLIVLLVTLVLLFCSLWCAMWAIVNGPSPTVSRLFILSLKETSAAGFLAEWFMSKEEIQALMAMSEIDENAEIDSSLINIPDSDGNSEGNSDGGEVSTALPDTDSDLIGPVTPEDEKGIEICDVSGPTYNGKMMIIKDPTRVIVGVPDKYGADCSGLSLTKMIEKYGAVGGTNAGGFEDINGNGTGGIPEGIIISEGNLLWGSEGVYYSLAGLDENGLLYVGKMTPAQALSKGIKYAASYGPALIINGEPCNAKRSLSGGVNPRTAIGQRADGSILLLVVNGRQINSLGATLDDLVEIMLSFGAVNASNLDGGSSSLMIYEGEYMNTSSYIYGGERVLASSILVK